jgi:hypothetical protein
MNLRELQDRYDTQEKCLAFIEKCRWPNGVRCVTCGCARISRITSSSKKQTVRYLFECMESSCKQQFTATSGTVMHDTHLPLQTWLMAIALVTQAKKGMSAIQLQRHLGLGSYKTAWHLCHRIREAMGGGGSPLSGIVEVDETYIGGKLRGRKRLADSKQIVVGLRQRGGDLKLIHTQRFNTQIAHDITFEHISPDVEKIMTDDSSIYNFNLTKFQGKHRTINHSLGKYVRGNIYTNTVESAFSLLKRGIIGNYHQVSAKHLHRYLSEFEFRFNNRKNPAAFALTVGRVAESGKRLPMQKLVS